jgi:hypothetical protein
MSTGTFKGENPVQGRDAARNKIFNACFGFKHMIVDSTAVLKQRKDFMPL